MSKEIIEINGVKLEVDLSTARRIEEYKVGDVIKVLVKEYSSYKSYAGTIVGFDAFKNLPTIIIAYLKNSYSDSKIEFVYYNAETEGIEICPACENDIVFNKETVVAAMDKEIESAKAKTSELQQKRDYFVNHFDKCFHTV